MNDTSPHDTSRGAGSANTVRARSGNAESPSGSHYIIGPLQKASGPRKKNEPRCLIFGTRTMENAVLQRGYIIESVLQLSSFMSEGPDRDGVQYFSSAVHPLCRLTDSQVALFFSAED